ncbi:MAG: prefoldin subunit beta [Candidatus Aenigmarchaeota archaeon]|nr:prefoldin subunit beta [Candidatus Aenigmarchaeota archaeon]
MTQMSPEAQQALMTLQASQQQIQGIIMQRDALNVQKMEIEKALEELEKSKTDDVYKAVGPILIKTNNKDLIKELKERQETINVRLKSLENQEKQIKERIEAQQEKLQEFLKSSEKPSAG